MTYGKAMQLAKKNSLEYYNESFIIYFDEEGNREYCVRQKNEFYMLANEFQEPQELWFNGQVEQVS